MAKVIELGEVYNKIKDGDKLRLAVEHIYSTYKVLDTIVIKGRTLFVVEGKKK